MSSRRSERLLRASGRQSDGPHGARRGAPSPEPLVVGNEEPEFRSALERERRTFHVPAGALLILIHSFELDNPDDSRHEITKRRFAEEEPLLARAIAPADTFGPELTISEHDLIRFLARFGGIRPPQPTWPWLAAELREVGRPVPDSWAILVWLDRDTIRPELAPEFVRVRSS